MFWIYYQQHTWLVDSDRNGKVTYYWVLSAVYDDVTGLYTWEIIPSDDGDTRLTVHGHTLDRAVIEQTILTYEATLPPIPEPVV